MSRDRICSFGVGFATKIQDFDGSERMTAYAEITSSEQLNPPSAG
jgi:hypothetical protein